VTAPQLRYWDSCCFIAWLAKEEDRVDECQGVVRAAEAGRLQIVTSSLTIAEVVKLKHHRVIPPEVGHAVRKFFRQPYILIRELDRFLAEEAQALVWDQGINPKDAVHVATAMRVGVVQLDTFDRALIAKSRELGSPPLVIGRPDVVEQLQLPTDDAAAPVEAGPSGTSEFDSFGSAASAD
jgi:predicted nucleic acid-binding protein